LAKFGAATRIHTKNKTVYNTHNFSFEKSGTSDISLGFANRSYFK